MKTRGFTILEILIVLSVLTIIMGISIPKIKALQAQSNVAKAKRELKTIQAAVESYRLNNANTNPSNIQEDLTGAVPQMLTAVLPDPFNTTDPTYQYSQSGKYYAISTIGPDGVNDTGVIAATGEVTSGGDDVVVTNGSVTEAAAAAADPCDGVTVGQACAGTTAVYAGVDGDGNPFMTTASDAPDAMSWQDAIDYCESLNDSNEGGFSSGWHLPTKDELNDVLWKNSTNYCAPDRFDWDAYECMDPPPANGVNASSTYWSATGELGGGLAWLQYFGFGFQDNVDENGTFSVRCVRSP